MGDRGDIVRHAFWRDEGDHTPARFGALVNAVDDGIFQIDPDRRFVAVNDSLTVMTGHAREKLLGASLSRLLAQPDRRRVTREIRHRRSAGSPDVETFTVGVLTDAGDPKACELRLTVLTDEDELRGTIGTLRDISDRKARERALEETRRQYQTLVENFPNGAVALVDEDLRYQVVGGTPVDPEAQSASDLEGAPIREVVTDELAGVIAPRYRAALEGKASSFEVDHGGAHSRIHIFPVRDDDGEIFAAMGMSQDITARKGRERRLEAEQRYTERILDAIEDVFYVVDQDGTFQEWNETLRRQTGYSDEEIASMHPLEFIVEEDQEAVAAGIEEIFATGSSRVEADVRTKGGDRLPMEFVASAVEDRDGDTVLVGIGRDISERKAHERALEATTAELETLFDVLPVGVVVGGADGELVAANDAAHEIWGGDVFDAESVEEYERYPVFDADTGESIEPEEMILARVLRGEKVIEPDVCEFHTLDDERRFVELQGMPIRDDDGEVVRGVVTMSDVTERWAAQQQLEKSERRYRTLVENFPEGVVGLFNENLEYTAMGGQLMEDLGVERRDRVGEGISDVYPPDVVETIEPHFRATLDGEYRTFEVELYGRHLFAHTLPIGEIDEEGSAGMIVIQDVTDRREYERKLEEYNARLEQFAHAASHDLQEPLRMVSTYLQMLEQRYGHQLDGEAEEFLEFAVDGADRMREMIDGLLAYSRIETEGSPMAAIDLNNVVDDVLHDLRLQIEETGAEVTTDDLPKVEGDAGQLRQVFQNLIENALEYSGQTQPRIHVSADRRGGEWVISVSDEGIGIAPDDRERIFEVFERLHTHADHEGTGIGLALCERILERHDGEIWVEGEPGEGATFSFTLSRAAESDA